MPGNEGEGGLRQRQARQERAQQRHEQARLRQQRAKQSAAAQSAEQSKVKSPLAMLGDTLGLSSLTEAQENLLMVVVAAPFVAVILYRWREQGVI